MNKYNAKKSKEVKKDMNLDSPKVPGPKKLFKESIKGSVKSITDSRDSAHAGIIREVILNLLVEKALARCVTDLSKDNMKKLYTFYGDDIGYLFKAAIIAKNNDAIPEDTDMTKYLQDALGSKQSRHVSVSSWDIALELFEPHIESLAGEFYDNRMSEDQKFASRPSCQYNDFYRLPKNVLDFVIACEDLYYDLATQNTEESKKFFTEILLMDVDRTWLHYYNIRYNIDLQEYVKNMMSNENPEIPEVSTATLLDIIRATNDMRARMNVVDFY